MRIDIKASALKWGVTTHEIVTVVSFPMLRISLAPRIPGATPVLHIGASNTNEPYLEVIVDEAPETPVAFHAMVLRRKLADQLNLDRYIDINYGTQKGAHDA